MNTIIDLAVRVVALAVFAVITIVALVAVK